MFSPISGLLEHTHVDDTLVRLLVKSFHIRRIMVELVSITDLISKYFVTIDNYFEMLL